jgi:hypothetical protein
MAQIITHTPLTTQPIIQTLNPLLLLLLLL